MTSAATATLSSAAIHKTVDAYYTNRLRTYGAVPLGVDWTCQATQELRFVQLLRIVAPAPVVSLNDLGCGYGALYGFIAERLPATAIDYLGVDLSVAMVNAARRRWRGQAAARFARGARLPRVADYSVASGIFNVSLQVPRGDWERTVQETLLEMRRASSIGIAVNFLAPLAPGQAGPAELYRTEPEVWVRFCERSLGARVELLQGYGLREFTLLVRC